MLVIRSVEMFIFHNNLRKLTVEANELLACLIKPGATSMVGTGSLRFADFG